MVFHDFRSQTASLLHSIQTHLEGTLPAFLAPSMQILHAEYSRISGYLPPELLRDMQNLRSVSFAGTPLSGSLPTELASPWLTRLAFAGSSLSGTLPTQLGMAKGLTLVDLSDTLISGTLPSELFPLSGASLRTLNVLGTRLSGMIPTSFATMGSLRHLYVPRGLTQPLRRKFCREELRLPVSHNYFWDLAAATNPRSDGPVRPLL